jgi:hypothetical protein
MLRSERGFSVYTIISVILLLALIFVLALPNFFNLDRGKNEETCINNMKLIWVASTDYMKDNGKDFSGDLTLLKTLYKKNNPKDHYIETIPECPENRGADNNYIVFGKYYEEEIQGTKKMNYATIVLCPNTGKFSKHLIPKSFYENMEPTELQNFFIEDIDAIDKATGSDGTRKLEMLKKYIEIWKSDSTALTRIRENPLAIRNQAMGVTTAAPVSQ